MTPRPPEDDALAVVDPRGLARTEACLRHLHAEGEAPVGLRPEARDDAAEHRSDGSAVTDAQGRFRIEGLRSGTHTVVAITAEGHERKIWETAVPADDPIDSGELSKLSTRVVQLEQRLHDVEAVSFKKVGESYRLAVNGSKIEVTPTGEVHIESARRVWVRSGGKLDLESSQHTSVHGGFKTRVTSGTNLELDAGTRLTARAKARSADVRAWGSDPPASPRCPRAWPAVAR